MKAPLYCVRDWDLGFKQIVAWAWGVTSRFVF